MRNVFHIPPAEATLAVLCAAACLVFAVVQGLQTVAGLSRPFDVDQFRDIAAAQSIADGAFPRDPFYREERAWYNPLVPALVALTSFVTGLDVATAFVRTGPLLNAAAPVVFFVLTATLFGGWPAVVAVASLLFSPPHDDPAWANPTYSPWLFSASVATPRADIQPCFAPACRRRWYLRTTRGNQQVSLFHHASIDESSVRPQRHHSIECAGTNTRLLHF
jgi:hypothetical protein